MSLTNLQRLQSAEEMEQEEREAQSAKLQELVRRNTPQDLQEANRIVKILAGYDMKHKTDYRAKAAQEVGKIQQKAKILEEMLQQDDISAQDAGQRDTTEVCSPSQSCHFCFKIAKWQNIRI